MRTLPYPPAPRRLELVVVSAVASVVLVAAWSLPVARWVSPAPDPPQQVVAAAVSLGAAPLAWLDEDAVLEVADILALEAGVRRDERLREAVALAAAEDPPHVGAAVGPWRCATARDVVVCWTDQAARSAAVTGEEPKP